MTTEASIGSAHRLLREASLELARLRRIRGAYRKTWRRIARAQARIAFAAALLAAAQAEPAAAGDPIFVSPVRIPTLPWTSASSPAFADIDGDGDLDAFAGLVGSSYGTPFSFAMFSENTGSASVPAFAAPSTNPFGLTFVWGQAASLTLADIDDDEDLDAFLGNVFFRNTGTASAPAFAAPVTNPFGLATVGDRASPAFADIDGDGDLDALIGFTRYGLGDVAFFRNTGTTSAPAFAAPSTNPFGLADVGFFASPAFADIDGDGDLDAFVGESSGDTIFFANTGTASAPAFAAPSANPFGLADVALASSPEFADIDGDGDLDAFVGDYYGNTIFFENTGTVSTPAFVAPPPNPFGLVDVGYVASPAFADIDGDADLDAFAGSFGNTIFFRNTGTASAPAFAAASSNPFGLADVGRLASPELVDIDGDDDLDAFVGEGYGNTIFFENTGTASTPAFAAASANAFGLADVGLWWASPAFADLDGDADLDALVGERFGNTIFFRNTGTASAPAFAAPSSNPFGLADVGYYASPTFADLDGDGDLDALVGEQYGNTIFFENTGTASAPAFAASSANPFGLAEVGYYASPTFADIDGDGDLDALLGVSFFENLELGPGTCTDGLDNDFDGRIDLGSDPGCADAADPNERSAKQCDNGRDDDGDGKVDWRGDGSGDPHCASLTDNTEAPTPPPSGGCGLGPELLLLGPLLAAAGHRGASRSARRRSNPGS